MIRKLKSGKYRLYSRKVNPKTGKRRNLGTFPQPYCGARARACGAVLQAQAVDLAQSPENRGERREARRA
jgi:hypothetical protein